MHFAFDEDQLEFRAQLRAFAEKQCTPADIREAWASTLGWSRPRWAALAEMGVVGITVPEEFGGMGLGLVDAVLLLEEAGRAGLPEPLVETVALGVPVLADAPGPQGERVAVALARIGGRRRGDDRRGDCRRCRRSPAPKGPTSSCSSGTGSSTPCPPPR